MRLTFYLLFAAIFAFSLAAPAAESGSPILPSEDDFYLPPSGFESEEAGTVLKIRRTPYQLRSVYLPLNVKNSWQLLVRSNTAEGNASAVVTTLIEPYNGNSSRLVSYQIAQDSAQMDCAASYAFQYGAEFFNNIVAQAEMFLIQDALNQGYWVSSPDYEGRQGSFTAGRNAGKAVLDTIRGVISTGNETGIDPNPDVLLWGYSGGSLAAGWAAAIQPWYAPDLSSVLIGAALGGFASNISTTVHAIGGSLYAGMLPAGIHGLMNEYPQLKPMEDKYFPKNQQYKFDRAGRSCLVAACAYYMYTNVFEGDDKVLPGGWDMMNDPIVANVITNTTLGVSKDDFPKIPLFIYHGELDNIVPEINTERIYKTWCDWGIESLEVTTSQTTRHITEAIFGSTAAMAWINKRFNHVPPVKGCTKQSLWSNLLYPGVTPQAIDLISGAVTTVFGSEIGPDAPLGKRDTPPDIDAVVDRYLHNLYLQKKNEIPV